jgi:hypothetical protein
MEASQPNPSGFVAVHAAWVGVENSLKAVLVKGGVSWDIRRGHDFPYLVGLMESNGLADKPTCDGLLASAITACCSGSQTNFKYPETDPIFFEGLGKHDIQNRTSEDKKVYDECCSIISGL